MRKKNNNLENENGDAKLAPETEELTPDELAEQLEEAKTEIDDLKAKLIAATTVGQALPKGFKGFIIEIGDPYVAGVKRFLNSKLKTGFISGNLNVEYKSPIAKATLENYILRAAGAGDTKRASWAKEELTKISKG